MNNHMPNWSELAMPERVEFCVDQVIVDGLVDGSEQRARFTTLSRIAFKSERVFPGAIEAFEEGLRTEERYVDRIRDDRGDTRYGYEPNVDPSSPIRPSLIAIVKGTALFCTQEEETRAFSRMEQLAEWLYEDQQSRGQNGILPLGLLSGLLREGAPRASDEDLTAFIMFAEGDPRFHKRSDGKIILADMYPDGLPKAPKLPEVQRISDLRAVLEAALPRIRPSPSGVIQRGAVLGTLRHMGFHFPANQVPEIFEVFASLDSIEPAHTRTFRRTD